MDIWTTLSCCVAAVVTGSRLAVDWANRAQQDLVKALLEKDEQAFSWFVQKNWPGMMRVARSILGNESLAAEVVQETWETVLKELGKFRGESSINTWMFRILINRAKRVGAREGRSIPFSSLKKAGDEQRGDHDADEFTSKGRWRSPVHGWRSIDPQLEVINREGLAILSQGMELLPHNQRTVVLLRDVEGVAGSEVCDMLGISPANQRILLHRGRSALRRRLEAAEAGPAGRGEGL
jgi:RNA polymerase sigma-70 factor (ECF subfamily)